MTPGGSRDTRANATRRRIGLSGLLRPVRRRRRVERSYAEEEVRDRIYGWHSGSVERPEPRDSYPHPLAQPPRRGRPR
ncbi:MAG TPA: hypothetical protein VGX51_11030 [Solirubrobacteraceae bacterium]|jgi:hypothetical protein|nr:hypothetical protein [Solirubrobacteraceae bacterium]